MVRPLDISIAANTERLRILRFSRVDNRVWFVMDETPIGIGKDNVGDGSYRVQVIEFHECFEQLTLTLELSQGIEF